MFHRKNKRQKKSQEMLDIDLMEEIGYYQKKPQKKGLDQKIVIALVLVVQQIEANVFYPRVVGNAVGLSGIWVMIAVLLGSGLFGIVGIVLCVPVMAVLYTLVSEWVNRRVEEKRFAAGMRETPPTEEEIEGMTER